MDVVPRRAGEESVKAAAKLPLGNGIRGDSSLMSDCDSSVMKERDRVEVGMGTFGSSQILPMGPSKTSCMALSWPLVGLGDVS